MKSLLDYWRKAVVVVMMSVSMVYPGVDIDDKVVEVNKINVKFSSELFESNNNSIYRLLYDPIMRSFFVEQTCEKTGIKTCSVIQRCDTDKVLRGISGYDLEFLLGNVWYFDYEGRKIIAFLVNESKWNDLVSCNLKMTHDMNLIEAALSAKPAGSYLNVVKIGNDFGLHLMGRLNAAGLLDAIMFYLFGDQKQTTTQTTDNGPTLTGMMIAYNTTGSMAESAVIASLPSGMGSVALASYSSSSNAHEGESRRAKCRREKSERGSSW